VIRPYCIVVLRRCSLLLQTEFHGLSWSSALQEWLNWLRCHLGCGPREPRIRWRSGSTPWRGNFDGEVASSGHFLTCSVVNIVKMTQQGSAWVWCRCQVEHTRWAAHWHYLTNTNESSVYGSDAALCQITLTSYYCHWQCDESWANFCVAGLSYPPTWIVNPWSSIMLVVYENSCCNSLSCCK